MLDEPEDAVTSIGALHAAVITALRDPESRLAPLVQVCRACTDLLPVDGASISFMTAAGHRETLYASDEVVNRIETLQFSLGEGPCFEAFETGRPVLVPDLAHASGLAWPAFAAESSGDPIGAIFAFPLRYGAARLGAIDMYRRRPGWLSPAELTTALQVADVAATALLWASDGGGDGQVGDGWFAELPDHREAVHQATGMLVAEFAIPAEPALARLRAYAFAEGRLIDDVASDLVARRLRPADIDT